MWSDIGVKVYGTYIAYYTYVFEKISNFFIIPCACSSKIIRNETNCSILKHFTNFHRRYYREDGELVLDVGAFTAALEFATGSKAKVMGKPEADFFMAALKDMEVSAANVSPYLHTAANLFSMFILEQF